MSPEYFNTELRPHEAEAYLKGVDMRNRAGYNQARMICDMWRSKESEPIVFPWEKKEEVINASKPKPPTSEQMNDLMNWSTSVLEQINRNHGR